MNRVLQLGLALVLTTVAGTTSGAAQSASFGLGGGLTMPLSDYSNLDNAGWHVFGKVDFGVPASPVSFRVDGMYAQTTPQSSTLGTSTKLAGGTADIVYHIPLPVPDLKPYLIGGGGLYNVNLGGSSETKFTWGAGLGTAIGLGPLHAFIEGRYMSVQLDGTPLKFAPVTAGISFGGK
jgi:hypothetical protein